MRLRNKPWAEDRLNEYPQYVIQQPETQKGKWHEIFGNDNPIYIEVGTGKGRFITEMAKAHPFDRSGPPKLETAQCRCSPSAGIL